MISLLALAQFPTGENLSTWSMIVHGTTSTKVVLGVLVFFSLLSWGMIIWKALQFRRLWAQTGGFMQRMETADRLEEAAVDEMSDLSFPASDPPSVSPGIAGRAYRDGERRP